MNIANEPQTGLIELNQWELLQVSGADAVKFLQGQLTCDVNLASAEQTLLGCYCNLQGRMVAAFRLFSYQENILLLLPAHMASIMQETLQKYAVFSKVTLTAAPTELGWFGTLGLDQTQLPSIPDTQIVRLAKDSQRLLITGTSDAVANMRAALSANWPHLADSSWRKLDIAQGIANVFPATQAKWLPHRVNYHLVDGISFTKGCFLGQEVIARLHYKSQLKHHMYRVRLHHATLLTPGAELYQQEKPIGHIVDSVMENTTAQHALVILPITHYQQPSLAIASGEEVAVAWLPLPYLLSTDAS
jgi:tRNA-modifying protein YgfZ